MFENKFTKEIKKLGEKLDKSKNIILLNHRRMDWDAFWSLSAFYYILKKQNKFNISVYNEDTTPQEFNFLKKEELFKTDIENYHLKPDLIITFDCWAIEQLWSLYENNTEFILDNTLINIDHHHSNNWFWDINIINTNMSSTCEITYNIIKELWLESSIDKDIASFLLTWIITDTNNFINTSTTSDTMQVASELLEYKPCHQEIITNLFKKKPYSKIKLWWKTLEWLKDIKEWKIVWNTITLNDFKETQTTNLDVHWLIDEFLITIEWLEIWFILYEIEKYKIKWSFRGKKPRINLSDFCSKWWWWWHDVAAWFITTWKNIYEVEQEVIEELKKYY